MAQSGITYFKLDTNLYQGDHTKKCSLTGGEIDENFNYLRGLDIVNGYFDEYGNLHLITLGDDDILIPSGTTTMFAEGVDFSGTSYDKETGVLNISINGETVQITGFTICDCKDIDCRLSEVQGGLSGLTEDFESFKNSMGELTTGGTLDVNKLFASVVSISGETVNNTSAIAKLEDATQSLNSAVKGLDGEIETISEHTESLAANVKELSDKTVVIETQLGKIQEETLNSVEKRLDSQDDKIGTIEKNVGLVLTTTNSALDLSNKALTTSKETLDKLKEHEITDVVLNGDQLTLHYKEPDHVSSPGVSLAKYNYTADELTIHKDKEKAQFSAIVDKEEGVVLWKTFKRHVDEYNTLLSQYNALAKEFVDYKNAYKTFDCGIYD